ncbi:hypothetical protein H7I77_05500 [Mycolicibacterium novocastrense]|uniref:Uncharacterized protein n=1 Tax=Mycolicibacterium novocastrense TaxID=59813 RepID=A0AAW5SFF5_MYCNV|nr:hypothetical protein [Mycolicibacterium novocastrense]
MGPDAAQWWRSVCDSTQTPVRELLDGFDQIAPLPVPYDWLPGRAETFYGDRFQVWSDLADETIESLVNRPKGGIGTVRAILIAGWEAAARAQAILPPDAAADVTTAVSLLVDRLTDYDYQLLAARGWALHPTTVPVTAEQLGVTQINVTRNLPRAYARFKSLLPELAHAVITECAEQLGRLLGTLTRRPVAEAALQGFGVDQSGDAGQILLHLAGPYAETNGGWLAVTTTDVVDSAIAVIDDALTRWGAPTTTTLTTKLGGLGIQPETALEFVESRPGLRRFGEQWVRWGSTAAELAQAALNVCGEPMSPAAIAEFTGALHAEAAIRQALHDNSRFSRATRTTWALRRWGLDEYGGLFTEIATRIDAAGGSIATADVIADISATVPDVNESSIRSYMGAPAFVVDKRTVRRRTAADGWPPVPPLNSVRGVFHPRPDEFRIAFPVTADLLRGSGQKLHAAPATALGVHPGSERTFTGTPCDVTVYWRLFSATGAGVGSLRPIAAALEAQLGETLVFVFNARDATVVVQRIALADRRGRLAALVGTLTPSPRAALAHAVGCQLHELDEFLQRRGEDDLLPLADDASPHESHRGREVS